MKLKYQFETVSLDDEIVAVPVGHNSGDVKGVLKLNQSGSVILELLKSDTSEDQIIDALSKEYENCRDTIQEYVAEFVKSLRKDGLIED